MKLLFENWRKYLAEHDEEGKPPDVIVIDHKNPPPSGDPVIDEIILSILSSLDPKDLHKDYRDLHKGDCDPLTGFCRITSEVFWELVSELEDYDHNYRACRVVHEGGPHYFIKDTETGRIIDLTAGQFRDGDGNFIEPPYEDGICDTEDKRSASLGWSNRKKGKNWPSKAMPGYQLGKGASTTIRRIKDK
jgi:hypothetical protein